LESETDGEYGETLCMLARAANKGLTQDFGFAPNPGKGSNDALESANLGRQTYTLRERKG